MNIRVNLNTNIADGSEVVFRSPADCSQVTGLVIYHHGGKTEFAFADAHGNNVGDIDHLFAENAVVKVILDVTSCMAFVQNADTNAYIERTFIKSVNGQAPDKDGNVEIEIPEGGNGSPSKDGGFYVPTVEQVNETEVEISFTSQGGENMPQVEPVKLTLPSGEDGKDGYTPVIGKDYYTPAEKAEFEAYIVAELAKRGQLKPELANSVEECTDTSKLYVLPDGYIYAYMRFTGDPALFTNLCDPNSADFKTGYRYNWNSGIVTTTEANAFVSNMFQCKAGDVLRIMGVKTSDSTSSTAPVFVAARLLADGSNVADMSTIFLQQPKAEVKPADDRKAWDVATTDANGVLTWTFAVANNGTNGASADVVNTRIAGVATDGIENIIITKNEEIAYRDTNGYTWCNTGHAFIPQDYEERIADLEAIAAALQEAGASLTSGAKWFALGDSITQGWASVADSSQPSGYRQFLSPTVEERWVNIVAAKNGYELTNYGIGGSGYNYATANAQKNARQQVDTIDFSECDFVTLAYGVNDWKYAANIGSMDDDIEAGGSMVANMRYVIRKILSDNPLCKIFVVSPINCCVRGTYDTNWGIDYTGTDFNGYGLEQICELQKAVCLYHGIEFIDMTHCSIVNRENIRTLLADSVHPTVEGHRLMARELAKKINFK